VHVVVLTVEDPVTKPQTARKLELRLATTAVEKDTSPGIVQQKQKPKAATSAVKKATSRVIARKAATRPAAVAVAEVVKNVTSAERSATLLVLAPSQLALEEITALEEVAEVTTLSVVEVEKPATLAVALDTFLAIVYRVPSVITAPDSVILAGTAPSPRGALAIPAVLKGSCVRFCLFPSADRPLIDTSLATVPTRPRKREGALHSSSTLLVPYFFSMISLACDVTHLSRVRLASYRK